MLSKIILFSIKNKLIVGVFTIGLIILGIYEVKELPIDAVPDITNNQVQIITVAPALGTTDIERLITFPIEQVNSNIPGLIELRSFSRFGLSIVSIVFEDDVDIYWARQQVSERLQQIKDELPKDFGAPFLAPVTTGLGEIYQYVVRPEKGYEDKFSQMDLRTIQDWVVRKQLLSVKGVAEVSSFGGLLKQYEISVIPEKLRSFNITIHEIFTALEKNNQNTGGAYIEKGPTALFIRSEGLVGNIYDIQNMVVKNLSNGIPLLIKDVAEVKLGSATRYGSLTYNGESQVSGAIVLMLKGANSNEVIQLVKNKIQQIQKTLPKGVVIEPFIDRTKMVNKAISTVTTNLIEGALIVVFVLVLFLGNLRAGLLVASVIPLSMLFAISMMNLFGISGNLMSLGALDFGLIIDGAVIIVEAVMHQFTKSKQVDKLNRLTQAQMNIEVHNSATRMMNSAVFGQIIILIVYLPIFTLQGIEGKMFKPMAQTVAFALVGAFILSLTYIPMMSSLILSKKISLKMTFSDKMMNGLEHFYQKMLHVVLGRQKLAILSVIILFIFSVYLFTKLGGEFIPTLPEGDYAVEARLLPGSNLNASIELTSKASKILLNKFPEVLKVVTKTGSSEVPTDPMPIEASDIIIVLKDREDWTSAKTYDELESKMAKELQSIAGVTFGFQYPVAMRFNELISGARQDVVCKIFGEDLDTLAYYAKMLGNISNTVKGSSGLYIETVSGLPQINIQYNRSAIAQYGLNIRDVNHVINTSFAGQVSGKVYEGEKRFDLVVRLSGENRNELFDVQNLLIQTPQGQHIPLSKLASVEISEGPNQIQRENSQRRIIVGFNVRGRDVESVVNELQKKVENQIILPSGYYITYGGAFENLEAAKSRLYIAVPISLVLIFFLLYLAFKSVKQGLLIYSAIPLSAMGGIIALSIRGISFSISAGVGFIALFGVAVLNGIVLIAEFNRLKKDGWSDINQIVIQGTKTRLRPVLMTALVASLGFLPMAISTGEGAEVQRPLATVVIGGLLIATFLTLFILPILYRMFHQSKTIQNSAILFIGLGAFTLHNNMYSQVSLTLQQATNIAIENNLTLKNEHLKTKYIQKLINTGTNIPSTYISGEYGQINSFFVDKRIGISQALNFPALYKRQKDLFKEEFKLSFLNVGVQEVELKKQVALLFYTLDYFQKKKEIFIKHDSLYAEFLDRSLLRYKTGESDGLEKITAENLRSQISLQLFHLEQDMEIAQLQFQLLLNDTTHFVVENTDKIPYQITYADSSSLSLHPFMKILSQQQQIAAFNTRVERVKLLPDFVLSYNVMSMSGVGADNKNYTGKMQFQSGQIGLGIPIFNTHQRAKIQASITNEIIAKNEYELRFKNFENQYKLALVQCQKHLETVLYYQNTGLKNAKLIHEAANLKFKNGELNYLDWILLINQAIQIQSDYIEALKNFHFANTELLFYSNY